MSTAYQPPIEEIILALEVAGFGDLLKLEHFGRVDRASVDLMLEEFGRLASEKIASSDRIGDVVGAHLDAAISSVTTPHAFREAYGSYVLGGWGALPFPEEFAGGELPSIVALAT